LEAAELRIAGAAAYGVSGINHGEQAVSDDIQHIRAFLGTLPPLSSLPLAEQRLRYDRAKQLFPLSGDIKVEAIDAGGVAAERITAPASRAGRTVLYLHGGGYVIGSADSHRHLAAAIAQAAQAAVLLPIYRLAPEHPYPAALDDALAAYRWLLDGGQAATRLVVAGDSAGGGLTIATLLSARDRGLPMAAGAALISPWVDLSCGHGSIEVLAARDPIVKKGPLLDCARDYLAGRDPKSPLASPVYGDLRGLPPLLIQVGSEEILLDDARELDRRARAQGVRSALEIWPEMIHVWHWFAAQLREGREAIAGLGEFVQKMTD
jgi:monoterpene epsilon-lactone hydrolase